MSEENGWSLDHLPDWVVVKYFTPPKIEIDIGFFAQTVVTLLNKKQMNRAVEQGYFSKFRIYVPYYNIFARLTFFC